MLVEVYRALGWVASLLVVAAASVLLPAVGLQPLLDATSFQGGKEGENYIFFFFGMIHHH